MLQQKSTSQKTAAFCAMPPKRGRRATTGASEAGQRALENGGCTGSVRRAARRFQRTPSNVKRLLEVVQQFHALGPLAAEGESVLGQCRAVATLLESEGIPISEPTVVKTTTDEITAYVERTKMKAQSPDTDVDRLLDQIIAQKEEFDKYEDGKNAAAAAKNAQDAILRGLAADTRRVATESLEASRVNADARAPAQPRPWVATPVGQFVGGAEVSEAETDLRKRKLAVQEQAVENDRALSPCVFLCLRL